MTPEDIKPGMWVITAPGIGPKNGTGGMLVDQKFLAQRKANQVAKVYSHVPGHGGDVWWLVHEGVSTYKNEQGQEFLDKSFIAPYSFTEFMPFKGPKVPISEEKAK